MIAKLILKFICIDAHHIFIHYQNILPLATATTITTTTSSITTTTSTIASTTTTTSLRKHSVTFSFLFLPSNLLTQVPFLFSTFRES